MRSVSKAHSNVPDTFIIIIIKVKVKIAQSCPTLCHSMDYIVQGILQARIL